MKATGTTDEDPVKGLGNEEGFVAGPEYVGDTPRDSDDNLVVVGGDEVDKQDGVKRIEAVAMTWTTTSLAMAYIGIFLVACATSLEGNTTVPLSLIATSSFNSHSLVSTITVVQQVVNAVIKPPMAKIADVLGRFEAYVLSITIFIIGYIQMAGSNNVKTFAAAQIFYSAGATGLQILQQIFIADTSSLVNRALFSTIPDLPFLATVWIGPVIADRMSSKWRWGYAMWSIILPVCFLPLALSMLLNERKARKEGLVKPKKHPGPMTAARFGNGTKRFVRDIDTIGIILLSAGFALILIPLTLAKKQARGWSTPWIIATLAIGPICLIAFPFWEARRKLVPYPLVPLEMMRTRTFCCGCALGFFYFAAFYMSVYPYFSSYLLVVQNTSLAAAGHITQTFTFTATVASVLVGFAIKYTHRYQIFLVGGSLIYIMGLGLMIRYRSQGSSLASIIGAQICLGIGGGMLNPAAQLGVQASVTHQEVAAATAVFLVAIEIGGAVGAAISGAIWSKMIPHRLALYLPDGSEDQATAIFNSVTVAANTYPVGSIERTAIERAYQDTMRVLLVVAICTAIPLLPLGLAMKNYHLDKIDQVKGRVVGGVLSGKGGRVREGKGWVYEVFGFGKGRKEDVREEKEGGGVLVGEEAVSPTVEEVVEGNGTSNK